MAQLLSKRKRRRQNSRQQRRNAIDPALRQACTRVLGTQIVAVEFPGGRSRHSYRLRLSDGRSVIATRRKNRRRGLLEENVLRQLNLQNAPVPTLLGTDGNILFQEDLGRLRLSERLHRANENEVELLLDASLHSLAGIHRAAQVAGLDQEISVAGNSEKWLRGLLARPKLIGEYLNVEAARPQIEALLEVLKVRQPRFVKWDTRPGNALVGNDGCVAWFDWEHCATRNRLDDAAWLLGDEYVPDAPKLEAKLLNRYLPAFADDLSEADAMHYLFAYGTFHMCVRLGLMLDNKGKGDWWDIDKCLRGDKVGITLEAAQRTCARAGRWAAQTPYTEMLEPWFAQVSTRLGQL